MLTFKQYLKEYLTPEQEERYKNVQMTDKARKATDHFFGKGNDEVKEDLKNPNIEKSEVHQAVERHLSRNISHDEYREGKINGHMKIGKLIKDNDLRNQFAKDNTRTNPNNTTGHYITAVRGTQVAGQTNSTSNKEHPKGHSWANQSCKNVEDGCNKHYLKHEIENGTVVVRAHDHTGQEIYRSTLQPYHNDQGHYAYAVDSEYGLKHKAFRDHAQDIAKRLSGDHKGGSLLYNKHAKVYNDNGVKTILHPNTSKEEVTKAQDHENPEIRIAALQYPNVTKDHLDKALNDKNSKVRKAAIRHPNATSEHIDKALNDGQKDVRVAAIQHPNATSEHINKALNDESQFVQANAVHHPNVTSEHLNKALNSQYSFTRIQVLKNPKITEDHLNKAINDDDYEIRADVATHPKATSNHLNTLLNDKTDYVRSQVLRNPNITKEHLNKALNDKQESIRNKAKELLNNF